MSDLRETLPPIRYRNVKEEEFPLHVNHMVRSFGNSDRAEIYFDSLDVSIPCSMCLYTSKPAAICLLLRSGDIGVDNLVKLQAWLESESCKIYMRKSSKLKRPTAITVFIDAQDVFVSKRILHILDKIRLIFEDSGEGLITVAYYRKNDNPALPG